MAATSAQATDRMRHGRARSLVGRSAPRVRRGLALLISLLLGVALLGVPGAASAEPGDVGIEGPSHAGTGTPTGTKRAESVLWFNDGSWWGNLWDIDSRDFHIFRFDAATQTWVDTGVATETRSNTHQDVLWDGRTLYVASHKFVNDGLPAQAGYPARLHRFSYDAGTDTYVPLGSSQISNYRTETLVIDKDTTGRLWATWQQGQQIWLNVTGTDGATWGAPYPHPSMADPNSAGKVSVDDTSALIAFGPGRMGLMWGRQVGDDSDGYYWSVRDDTAPTGEWSTPMPVVKGMRIGDDHMNLKWLDSSGDRVFAAVKTSLKAGSQPLIQLLAMAPGGTWTTHTIATVSECPNRVIVLIDEAQQRLRTFATYPKPAGTTNAGVCSTSGGAIYEKSSPLDAINFTPDKTVRILDVDQYVHNVSSTKQNLNNGRAGGSSTANSGVLVIADVNATSTYWSWYDGPGGGTSDTTAPTVTAVSPEDGAADVNVAANVTVTFSEAMDPATINDQTVTMRDSQGNLVPAGVAYDGATLTAVLDPATGLAPSTTYSVTITGGATGVTDTAGNRLAADRVSSFSTAAGLPTAPTASFTASPTSGEAPLTVQFTDTSSDAPTSWNWSFGDGATSTDQNPAHTYTAAGTYEVSLTVSNDGGSSTSGTTIITVETTGGGGEEVVRIPVADDGYVSGSYPTRNYGTATTIWVDSSPVNVGYLKFDLSAYAGRSVIGATLEIRTTSNGSVGQQRVRLVADDSWSESRLTYGNAPALGAQTGTLGPAGANTANSVPLTVSDVQAELGQALSLGLDSTSSDAVGLVSSEGASPPELVLTLAP